MAHKSLFASSVSFAFKNITKNFLKLFVAILVAMIPVVIGFVVIVGAGWILYQSFFFETLVHWLGVEYATQFANSWARPVCLIIAFALLGCFALLVIRNVIKVFLRYMATILAIARDNNQVVIKDFKVIRAVVVMWILLVITVPLQMGANQLIAHPAMSVFANLFISFIMIRFQYAWFILIEKSVSALKAIRLSFTMTSGHMFELFKIVLVYNLLGLVLMMIRFFNYKLHWSICIGLFVLNIVFYLPFSLLMFARSYVLLDEK